MSTVPAPGPSPDLSPDLSIVIVSWNTAAILRDWWRRSGGRLDAASDTAIEEHLVQQLRSVDSLDHFLETRLVLEPERLVGESERARLDELPAMFRLFGDAVPIARPGDRDWQ